MSILFKFVENRVLFAAVLGWFFAQVAKSLFTLLFTRKWNPERLWGAGGMPSAHSSMVCALTVSMARFHGINSPFFAFHNVCLCHDV